MLIHKGQYNYNYYEYSISVDVLLYLSDGLLPFLQVFYTMYFELPSCSKTDPKRVISETIYTTLLVSKDCRMLILILLFRISYNID